MINIDINSSFNLIEECAYDSRFKLKLENNGLKKVRADQTKISPKDMLGFINQILSKDLSSTELTVRRYFALNTYVEKLYSPEKISLLGRRFCYCFNNQLYEDFYEVFQKIAIIGARRGFYCDPNANLVINSEKDIVLQAVKINGDLLGSACADLRDDKDVVLAAVTQNGLSLRYASSKLRCGHIPYVAVVNNGLAIQYASSRLRNYELLQLFAFSQNPYAIQCIGESLCSNFNSALIAIKKDGKLLNYVSSSLRANKKLVKMAVTQEGEALKFASKELQSNKAIVMIAVKQNGLALRYASNALQNDSDIVIAAVSQNGLALEWIGKKLIYNLPIIERAVTQNALALQFVSSLLKDKVDSIAVNQNPKAFVYAGVNLRNNKAEVLKAIQKDPSVFVAASDLLQADIDIAREVISRDGLMLQYAFDTIKDDKTLVLFAVNQNGLALQYASPDLQNNEEVVMAAIAQSVDAFEFASDSLKNDIKIKYLCFYKSIPDDLCMIGNIRYYASELSDDVKCVELPELSQTCSIAHLKKDLLFFIENLKESDLPTICRELREFDSLEDAKKKLREYHTLLFERLKNQLSYIGTPAKDSAELKEFYWNIKIYLLHLDTYLSKEKNQMPNCLIERLQLLNTQSACGSKYQGELEQLFATNCMLNDSIALDKQLAIIVSSEARSIIEGLVIDNNVHHYNILLWQLDRYLIGKKVIKDAIAVPENEIKLIGKFLKLHTSLNIVNAVQQALMKRNNLKEQFDQFVYENIPYEITELDEENIKNEVEEIIKDSIDRKLNNFEKYLAVKASSLIGNLSFIQDSLRLTDHEISFKNSLQFKAYLEENLEEMRGQLLLQSKKSLKVEKIFDHYYDSGKQCFNLELIALVLTKMGILRKS